MTQEDLAQRKVAVEEDLLQMKALTKRLEVGMQRLKETAAWMKFLVLEAFQAA